jgi:hypothetical protein|tara:strand:- start:455 stop:724 length:270 start_codon:yes stop_codon:yes gene_type:complete
MAYSAQSLSRVAGASGFSLWHYSTADTIATVNTAGYFNDAAGMIALNDYMIVVTSTGGTPVVSHAYCNANNGSVVDIVNGVAITATDSD